MENLKLEMLKFCQWNCRSAIANKGNLENLLSTNNINIALLSETWFKPNIYTNFDNFNNVHKDRPDGKGGVAILIKKQIRYTEVVLPTINNCMQVCITIDLQNNSKLTLVSLYVPPQTKITLNEWNLFFNAIPKPFIVGGDFNSHHIAWGCDHSDTYGKILLDSLDNNNLTILNDGSPTYIGNYFRQKSAIDLTICTPQLHQNLEWTTLSDPFGSDHLPIIVNCQFIPNWIVFKDQRKWNIKKAN